MKRAATILLLAVGCCITLHAETHLSGEIQSASLDASGNPYFVEKDIVVPSGKKLTLKEGCVFLFNQFSGLNVNGNLSVEGSSQRPVIFSCVNDGDFNPKSAQLPNPFDWNGIIIAKESGSVHMQNFQLRYSVYGIKSQNTSVTIQNGIFRQNGQFHFTLNDKIQYVQDNISYSFNAATDSSSAGGGKNGQKGASPTRNIIRYSCLGIGVVGLAVGTVFAVQASNTLNKMNSWNLKSYPNSTIGTQAYNDFDTDRKSQLKTATIFYVLGGLGVAGFTATFFF
jgi:hypothetical protein